MGTVELRGDERAEGKRSARRVAEDGTGRAGRSSGTDTNVTNASSRRLPAGVSHHVVPGTLMNRKQNAAGRWMCLPCGQCTPMIRPMAHYRH